MRIKSLKPEQKNYLISNNYEKIILHKIVVVTHFMNNLQPSLNSVKPNKKIPPQQKLFLHEFSIIFLPNKKFINIFLET